MFYESYLGVLLFLGFWFKFSVILSTDAAFTEGFLITPDEILPRNFDDALIASMVGFFGIISFGHLREVYFYYPEKINHEIISEKYIKFRALILTSFFLLIALVCLLNFNFKIYQRGLVGSSNFFLMNIFVKTSLLYFLTLISAVIIYLELISLKKISLILIIISIFETFISSISMLSRGMIFNAMALVYGIYKFANKIKIKLGINFFIKLTLFVIISFYLTVIIVNHIRTNNHGISAQAKLESNITQVKERVTNSLSGVYYLMINRWVGIDAMLIVNKDKKILNLSLLKESLKEKFTLEDFSFYEQTFKLRPLEKFKVSKTLKGNTLPGFLAYLFFSGSFIFLFISVMFFCLIAYLFEYSAYKILNKNMIASSVIGLVVAYRFAHFGYLPTQSYLLFGSIVGILLMFFLIRQVLKKL